MKNCDACDWGHVFLYVDYATGANAGWFCRECGKRFTDAEVEKLDGEVDPLSKQRMGPNAMFAAAFDLVSAARRVRARFGTDDTGKPLDWTEWRDVDDACNAIDRIAANAELTLRSAAQRS